MMISVVENLFALSAASPLPSVQEEKVSNSRGTPCSFSKFS
jgi:hypothetical protein